MRILVLSKRQYMGKDLLDDAYGRFHELPLELARQGHDVHGLCASYRARNQGEVVVRAGKANVTWQARNVRPYSPLSLYGWIDTAKRMVRDFSPSIIWACSDSFHAILGTHLQRRFRIPCVIDLYDNFESFAATRIPGVRPLFRAAVRAAAGITCVSESLRAYVRDNYGVHGAAQVLANGVSSEFRSQNRDDCRRQLGLPLTATVIGTAGAIGPERGTEILFEAFLQLAQEDPNLMLLLAGRVSNRTNIPSHERIIYLGQLPTERIPCVIGAMNVSVVCNTRSAFGDYCFPQKLYEIIACGVPPLVANTPGVIDLLKQAPSHSYEPGSVSSMKSGLRHLLENQLMPPFEPVTWAQHGSVLNEFLKTVAVEWQGSGRSTA